LLGDIQVIKSDFRSALGHYNSALDLIEHEPMDPNKTNLLVNDLRTKISRVAALTGQESPSRDFSYSNYIPHNIRENYLRALALSQTDPDSALHYYFLCLEANDCPLVNFRIGDLLYQSQDKEALAFYKKAYPAYKKDPDFLVRYSVAYMFNQNPVKAKEIYLELANLSPTHPALARLKEVIGM
jgi:tetratricopeptide (TPR) repeat protein